MHEAKYIAFPLQVSHHSLVAWHVSDPTMACWPLVMCGQTEQLHLFRKHAWDSKDTCYYSICKEQLCRVSSGVLLLSSKRSVSCPPSIASHGHSAGFRPNHSSHVLRCLSLLNHVKLKTYLNHLECLSPRETCTVQRINPKSVKTYWVEENMSELELIFFLQ